MEANDSNRLRDWLAGRLRRREIPAVMWDVLVHHDQVWKVRNGEVSREKLAESARPLLQYIDVAETLLPSRSSLADAVAAEESDNMVEALSSDSYELRRARALAEYVALLAAMYQPVRRFREDFFDTSESRAAIADPQEGRIFYEEILESEEASYSVEEKLSVDLNGYWNKQDALAFIMRDSVAVPSPVSVCFGSGVEEANYGTITVRVEPWVHADTVLRLYREQQMYLEGRRPRVFSSRNLEVVRFVLRRLRMRWYAEMLRSMENLNPGERDGTWYAILLRRGSDSEDRRMLTTPFSWKDLMESWNNSSLGEQYDDERRFYQDFYRTARVVVSSFRFNRRAWFTNED